MFTGIITNQAQIKKLEFNDNQDCLLVVELDKKVDRQLEIGCSIANNGICLTLVKKDGLQLHFEASKETCEVTSLKNWQVGQVLNIEFALKVGDELGGHMVSGHVDGVAKLSRMQKIQDSWRMEFEMASKNLDLMKFVAKKGSICIDGISLTINAVTESGFAVNIISHTFGNTNLGQIAVGDKVNIEVDLVARYVLNNN
jgi:riboflavin synthase